MLCSIGFIFFVCKCERFVVIVALSFSRSLSKESNKEDSIPRYDNDDFCQEQDKDTSFEKEETAETYVGGYRRDGRQGPTPKFRVYSSSDELQKREASQRKFSTKKFHFLMSMIEQAL